MSVSTTQATTDKPYVLPTATAAMASVRSESPARASESAKDTIAPTEPRDTLLSTAKAGERVAIVLDDAQIPLIDLDAITNAPEAERVRLVQAFGNGLRDVGFVAVKAESLSPLIKQVTDRADVYFDQTLDVKLKDDHKNSGQTGFSQRGSETAAGAKEADNKEFFHISPDLDKWPSEDFKKVMQEYHKELTKYAARLMALVEECWASALKTFRKASRMHPICSALFTIPRQRAMLRGQQLTAI